MQKVIIVISLLFSAHVALAIQISGLGAEGLNNPLGLHDGRPRLSWLLESEEPGQAQTAYRILVATDPEKLKPATADLWDSGRVKSDSSILVRYKGKRLKSRQRCWWTVRVWDKNGAVSEWAHPSFWEMGLLHPEDWKARWISAPETSAVINDAVNLWMDRTVSPQVPQARERLAKLFPASQFRKEFTIAKKIKRARAYICGLGYYEFYLNGRRVGDHVLDAGQTDYDRRALYVVYDVTDYVQQGENAAGILLGDGWYAQSVGFRPELSYGNPGVICQVELVFDDGGRQTILSDGSWRWSPSPIVKNNIYAGEVYDARLETPGWAISDFDDSAWEPANEVSPLSPRLEPQLIPAIKRIRSIQPVAVVNPRDGVWVFDLGENIAGWARIKLTAPAGRAINLRFAEYQQTDGMVNFSSTGHWATGVIQSDMYICKGAGIEVWEPHFTYHGFRYVEVTGLTDPPAADFLEGIVVHTDLAKTGTFESSDPMLNRVHETVLRTFESNIHSIPTDCPHRERCGWLGDAHVITEMTLYNYDMKQFWHKFVDDMETNANMDVDRVPTAIVPGKRRSGKFPDWGVATVIIPYYQYLYYGDIDLLRRHYEYMSAFMDWQKKISEGWIIKEGLGDWCDPVAYPGAERIGGRGRPQHTKPEVTSTIYFAWSAKMMSEIADVVGRMNDAEKFRLWFHEIKAAFLERYFNESANTFGSQTADGLALYIGLVPDGLEEKVAAALNRDVVEKHNGHYSTGSHGNSRLYPALTRFGYDKTALGIFHKRAYPSFNYLFSLGGTTLWERMGQFKPDAPAPDRSLNHPFHGGFDYWFYSGIGGIHIDPKQPAFKHFILNPALVDELHRVDVTFASPYGKIESHWKNEENRFVWKISIPVNTSATVIPPARLKEVIVNEMKQENLNATFADNGKGFLLESGTYTLVANKSEQE